jgi:hypothetical protein
VTSTAPLLPLAATPAPLLLPALVLSLLLLEVSLVLLTLLLRKQLPMLEDWLLPLYWLLLLRAHGCTPPVTSQHALFAALQARSQA